MISPEEEKIVGYIYKISHPMVNGVYIGQTELPVEERFKSHVITAKGKKPMKGEGALYEFMRALGPESKKWRVKTVEVIYDIEKMNEREEYWKDYYDSVKNGLNSINPPKTIKIKQRNIKIKIEGKTCSFSSKAALCREYNISYTALNYWLNKKKLNLNDAVKKALEGKKKQNEKGFTCYRRFFKSYTDLAKEKQWNKYNLTGREIAARVRNGMSVEDALRTPKIKRLNISIDINGETKTFNNITDAYKKLSETNTLPAYSTVIQRIEKGETNSQAFGFEDRPWKEKFKEFYKLERNDGYQWKGEVKSWSIPVVVHHTKEIFATKKKFAEAYGLEYTETSKKIKNGMTIEEILKESGHI